MSLQTQVLYNVLKTIKNKKHVGDSAPNAAYVRALETIGLIRDGWDTELTEMGNNWLEYYERLNWK
jgi:hypothetical protein